MGRPTVQTLAAELQVSRQTVSNVLNAPERVHPLTRQRVLEAIERSGYRPSVAARALRNQRSMSIALRLSPVGDGMNGAVMDGFLHALVERADASGYRIVIFTARNDADEVEQLTRLLESNAIDACVITDTRAEDSRPAQLCDRGVPFAAFGRPWNESNSHAWVDIDGQVGTRQAVAYLRSLGHERIGFIGWPGTSGVGADRKRGWRDAMALTEDEAAELSVAVTDNVGNGAKAAAALLRSGVEAVVCASDSLALGALTELRTKGVNPAVVGFDDTPVARAIGMSSVRQPVEDAAAAALDLVIALLNDPEAAKRQILLPSSLVVRDVADFLY